MTGLKKLLMWKAIAQNDIPKIDGIPVYIDGAYFHNTSLENSQLNNRMGSEDFFIAGVFDTGSEDTKTYTRTVFPQWPRDASVVARFYNILEGNSTAVSLFPMSYSGNPRTTDAAGRYCLVSIYKPAAKDAYMYYTVNGVKHYLYKGSNVTE